MQAAVVTELPPEVAKDEVAVRALEDELARVCGALNATTARLVGVIAKVLETGSWVGWGVHSPEQWVGWKCGVSSVRARRLVAMARRLGELPETRAAFEEGALGEDATALICLKAPSYADAAVASFARSATVGQLRRVLADYVWPDDEATPPDPEPTTEPTNDPEPASRLALSWADALVELAERSLGPIAVTRPHHDRHMVLLHLREEGSHLHLGPGLPQSLRRYLGCDGWVRPVIDRDAVATSVGRALRIVPWRTRVAVEERDRGCRVPWCDGSRRLQIHHIVHWEDGGRTDTANLVCLCARHHRLHHQRRLGISGDADDPGGLVFTDERGRRHTGSGQPAPPGDLDIDGSWTPPSGERLQRRWVHLG